MKLPLSILVVACVLAILSVINLTSCTPERSIRPDLEVGRYYAIKSDVFNQGSFQPVQPVKITRLYINSFGEKFAECMASVNWSEMNKRDIAQQTIDGNRETLKRLSIKQGDTTSIVWNIPQNDLK